jgi:hypothetical protein
MIYHFYKKDKMIEATFILNLTYGFFAVLLFVFPYTILLAKFGEYLNLGRIEYLKNFGGYLLGSAYVLSTCALMLAFCLLVLLGISLILKLLSDFLKQS